MSSDKDKQPTKSSMNSPATKQVVIGAASGWFTGYLTQKVGKAIAFTVGSGIIIYQLAHQSGYITTTWGQIRGKAEEVKKDTKIEEIHKEAPTVITKIKKYSRSNTPFAAGFLGGFLLGIST